MVFKRFIGLLVVLVCLTSVVESALQLIGGDGHFITSHQLTRQVPLVTDRVLNVLDCTFDSKCEFLNEVLGTSFRNEKGVSVDLRETSAVQYSSTDSLSPDLVGTMVDYYIKLSEKVVLLFDASQIESSLDGHDRMLRKLVAVGHKRVQSAQKTEINIICVGQSTDPAYVEDVVTKRFELLWRELESSKSFKESVSLRVLSASSATPAAVRAALEAASLENAKQLKPLDLLSDSWTNAVQTSSFVSSKEHQHAVATVEATYLRNLIRAIAVLNQWQSRVSAGKMVADFGRRVKDLMTSVQKDFQEATAGGSAVKERVERLAALNKHLVESIAQLQAIQLNNLVTEMEDKCRKELLRQLRDDKEDSASVPGSGDVSVGEKLVRRLLFDFKTKCDTMTNDWLLSTMTESHQLRLATSLEAILRDFPESHEYRVAAQEVEMRRAQRNSGSVGRNGKKSVVRGSQEGMTKKGKLSGRVKALLQQLLSGFSVTLVGMLRPPGHGNLQAVISTASQALWGIPVNYLLGIQNDGESMEVMGDDKEYPLIRLQPKFNFNLDL